ncbi:MAG: hypothetical protein KDI13_00625 [Alphaproteobacteria bacterium]|nr:hypothetical protein [Alphaproteobacteria bacterium]
MSPQAMEDLNVFLEHLPQNANKTLLIVAAVIWSAAGALGLFTAVKIQEHTARAMDLEQAQALLPVVPKLQDQPVNAKEVATFVDELKQTYKGLDIKGNSANIVIIAKGTGQFGEFREAIGHVQNGGAGWRVNLDKLCVGRECPQYPLAAALKINRVTVSNGGA